MFGIGRKVSIRRAALRLAVLGMLSFDSNAAEPVRFLLTFDDGPSLWQPSPTVEILEQLADNPVTPNIKAVFFVQAVHSDHGGNPAGRALMRRECAAGDLVGLHSGSPRGHVAHTRMGAQELADSLVLGRAAIQSECSLDAGLVRPPDWAYNDDTLAAYRVASMEMLLTDLSANDGKIYGWIISLRRRSHLHDELELVAQVRAAGHMPAIDGVIPVVVTMHDTNPYTAEHMTEYLRILVEESAAVGLPLADPPFYTDTAALDRAARLRASQNAFVCDGVSRSVTLFERLFGDPAQLYRGCL